MSNYYKVQLKKDISLYVHIPFCDHKCIYCDFYSIINLENKRYFLSSLKREISYFKKILEPERYVTTIFFGGGTPSLMGPGFIHDILNIIHRNFEVSDKVEITLETNPGTVNKEVLAQYRESGINRLSIGVQSFHDKDLEFLTRIHTSTTATQTVNYAAEAGFENINVDLIFNLPGQTKNEWLENLQRVVSLPVTHVSAYSLILERGTILNKMVLDGKVKIGDEDYDAELYETTIDYLTSNNFIQYEISNFCKSGYECEHNLAYWNHKDYLGLGPSAHSFVNGKRWWNFSSLKRYISEIEKKENAIRGEEKLTSKELLEEFVMLALRSKGLDLTKLKSKFGASWYESKKSIFQKLKNNGLLIWNNDFIKFTPKGYSLCDEILLKIL